MIEITWKWNVKCQDRNWMRMTWGFYWIIPCDSWSGSSSCSLFCPKPDCCGGRWGKSGWKKTFWKISTRGHRKWTGVLFDATHQDMTCERQWHLECFSTGRQCLLSHVDISHVCSCFFAARTLQHLLQIGQYRRQPSRCCNFINTDLQSSEFCIFLYDVCQWLLSWVQLMLWTLAVASSMRFLMLFASFLFILSEVQNFLFVQATPGRHSGPSILEATFQWAFNLKLIVEEKGVRVA